MERPSDVAHLYSAERVWSGDLEEVLNASSAIGDDRLQKRATGKNGPPER